MTSLDDLPPELVLLILDFVPAKDLWRNVRLTCHFFAAILSNDQLWASRIQKKHGVELPRCQTRCADFSLVQCCAEVEEEKRRWNKSRLGRHVSVTGHVATVDAIKLFDTPAHNRLCISGSRDRSLVVWDVNKIAKRVDQESWKLQDFTEAHQGWIWSVCKAGADTFYSCGWDRFVKLWQLANTGVEPVCGAEMTAAVLCVVSDRDMAICSSFDRKICALDARANLRRVAEMEFHRNAVFDLAHQDGSMYLYSCSQDRRVACVDRRMWRVRDEVELRAYAQTLSLDHGQLLCGTADGKIVLMDPADLSIINELTVATVCRPIRQVKLNLGSQICITKNRRLKMFTPGEKPQLFAESAEFDAEPSRFDYYNGDLAVTCGDGSVLFWTR